MFIVYFPAMPKSVPNLTFYSTTSPVNADQYTPFIVEIDTQVYSLKLYQRRLDDQNEGQEYLEQKCKLVRNKEL